MKVKKRFGVLIALMLILASGLVMADAKFLNNAGSTQSLYYTGTSSTPGNLYADAITPNQDVKLEICDVGNKYAGAFYAIRVSGIWSSALASYSTSTKALASTVASGGACYQTTPSAFTVSPSKLDTFGGQPDPEVFKAGLPGNMFIGYGSSDNPGIAGIEGYIVPTGTTRLLGSYSINRQFNQLTRDVEFQGTPTVTFQSSSGTFQKNINDNVYGIGDERPLVYGICDDYYGENCSSGELLISGDTFSDKTTGLSPAEVNDQNVHNKYVVMNGLGYPICIGANLAPQIDTIDPDPVYYSQDLEINITLKNTRIGTKDEYGGNVDVNSNFDVFFEIYPVGNPAGEIFNQTFRVSDNIPPDGNVFATLIWPAYAHSGDYTVRITIDSGSEIAECVEGDNQVTRNFELKPITLPTFIIDGLDRTNFPVANVPYNVTFHVENSDGDILNNAAVIMKEVNGLTLSGPTQIYEKVTDEFGSTEKTGLIGTNEVKFYTDYYGNASFVYIPTYNKLYLPQYTSIHLEDYVGYYSMSMYGEQDDGVAFKFVVNGDLMDEFPLGIVDYETTQPIDFKGIMNTGIVSQVLDFMYQTYSHFVKAIRVS